MTIYLGIKEGQRCLMNDIIVLSSTGSWRVRQAAEAIP